MSNVIPIRPVPLFQAYTDCDHCGYVQYVIFSLDDFGFECMNCGLETNIPSMRPGAIFEEEEDYY